MEQPQLIDVNVANIDSASLPPVLGAVVEEVQAEVAAVDTYQNDKHTYYSDEPRYDHSR